MSFADDILNRLFGQEKKTSATPPQTFIADSGPIKRSAQQMDVYFNWKSNHGDDLLFEIRQNVLFCKKNLGERLEIVLLDQRTAKGLRFNANMLNTPQPQDWLLMDLLKDQVKSLGYVLQNSEFRRSVVKDKPLSTEMYYLKLPIKLRMTSNPTYQAYGNIMINKELTEKCQITLLATTYEGVNYAPALPFDDLIDRMFAGLSS